MKAPNQHPEQIARDKIDAQLTEAGWCIQDKSSLDPSKGLGIAFKEYPTDVGPAEWEKGVYHWHKISKEMEDEISNYKICDV